MPAAAVLMKAFINQGLRTRLGTSHLIRDLVAVCGLRTWLGALYLIRDLVPQAVQGPSTAALCRPSRVHTRAVLYSARGAGAAVRPPRSATWSPEKIELHSRL
eukprot:356314-Chlamydomonas_euryale.AAC.4